MKKIILLLCLLPFSGFSQNQTESNLDIPADPIIENKILFENYKKQIVYNSQVKDYLSNEIKRISAKTNDSLFVKSCTNYLETLKNVKTLEAVKVNLENAPKELLNKFYVDIDKFNKTVSIYHRKNMGNQLQLSMQIYKGKAIMLLKTYFNGEWVILTVNNQKYKYSLKDTKRVMVKDYIFRNNEGNYVDADLSPMIEQIATVRGIVEVRFVGNKSNTDFILDSTAQQAIKETFYLYNIIKEY